MATLRLFLTGVAALVTACQAQTRLVEEPYLLRTHGRGLHRLVGWLFRPLLCSGVPDAAAQVAAADAPPG